ncbi:unnamed protein product [Candidula unifasciata]|uniref:Nocturnin n=1 Tax=Candidula unifasciata TaxID=100452 RepID=A0A8S3ZBZ1_9EUPU|nr:unnamed protein product [Candidula unifasciata]
MSEAATSSEMLLSVQEKSRKINRTPLLIREFVKLGEAGGMVDVNGADRRQNNGYLRVMQWNLLAQGLCQSSDGFVLCPSDALDWQFRQFRIIEELLSYSADIYCLEEVDNFSFIEGYLSKLGFKGCFCPKPDSPCLYQANNFGPDGCAIFWSESKVRLLKQDSVILHDDKNRETNQVALMCTFRGLAGNMKDKDFLCVATHLKSKLGYDELRHQQGKFLEKYLRQTAAEIPLILCGDFNADPQSKAVSVLKASNLQLKSTYTLLSSDGAEPVYTTWKVRAGRKGQANTEVCHTIDYLFVSGKQFQVVQLLKLPTPEEIGPGFLPSYSYPSDHISLVADLKFVEFDHI